RYAVTVLGTTMVRALAAAQVFRLNVRDARSLPPSFWEHSFATAAAAANLAVGRGVETSDAFSAGMLLDVGAALLRRNDPSRYAVVEQLARIPDESLIDAERRMFAIDHAEVGAFALDRLHFPRTFCTAVGEHHLLPSFRSSPLARVLFLAELVSHMVDGTPQESPITLGAAFEYLGEEPAQAELLVERARETLDSLGPLTDLLAARPRGRPTTRPQPQSPHQRYARRWKAHSSSRPARRRPVIDPGVTASHASRPSSQGTGS